MSCMCSDVDLRAYLYYQSGHPMIRMRRKFIARLQKVSDSVI